MIEVACYVLLGLAWLADLLTPQLLIVSILFNGPIALSTLTLRRDLTVRLTLIAEVANALAGYVNGLQTGHFDGTALANRALLALSFVIVAILTMRSQGSAREAGEADERARSAESERALRHALEAVRSSLSIELILRSALREVKDLTGADRVLIFVRRSSLDLPERYELAGGDVDTTREPLSPALNSIVERARSEEGTLAFGSDDVLGRTLGGAAFVRILEVAPDETVLVVRWNDGNPYPQQRAAFDAFADNLAVALVQARMFLRLAAQNEEIVAQRNELQHRSDVIRDIVYALAHDLRTPLAAADLTMNQAASGAYGELPEKYREMLKTSIESNAGIRRLVETLLMVARYEAGEDSRAFASVGARDVIERVIDELRPVAQAKEITVAGPMNGADATLFADGDEIRRAITNLVANAVEATPAHGRVDVTLTQDGDRVIIAVEDDGYGVPPDRRASLFQRFGGVRSGAGTGLGLYVVRRITEKYGGRAGYEPRLPQGSRFFVELPRERNVQ